MTAGLAGLPPGRAGRLWLTGRLEVARRAANLLERKEQLLVAEQARLSGLLETATQAWVQSWREASTWTARAALIGGQHDFRQVSALPAEVEVSWRNTMGITYPQEGRCRGDPQPASPSSNPALATATAANRRALAAALDQAVTARAYAIVSSELNRTRRNLRAVTERRLPELTEALSRLEERLDELEREERMRTAWAQEK